MQVPRRVLIHPPPDVIFGQNPARQGQGHAAVIAGELEAIQVGLQAAMALELKDDDDDAKKGKEKKLPSTYRLVIYQAAYADFQQKEDEFYAALPEGAERIDPQVARKLIEGAEVIDLRSGAFLGGHDPTSLPGAGTGTEGTIDYRQKHPHVGKNESQVVVAQAPHFEGFEPTSEATPPAPDHPQVSDSGTGEPSTPSTGVADPTPESGSGSQEGAAAGPAGRVDERKKHPHVGKNESQLVPPQGPTFLRV